MDKESHTKPKPRSIMKAQQNTPGHKRYAILQTHISLYAKLVEQLSFEEPPL